MGYFLGQHFAESNQHEEDSRCSSTFLQRWFASRCRSQSTLLLKIVAALHPLESDKLEDVDREVCRTKLTCETNACGCPQRKLVREMETVTRKKLTVVDQPVDPCRRRPLANLMNRMRNFGGALAGAGANSCCEEAAAEPVAAEPCCGAAPEAAPTPAAAPCGCGSASSDGGFVSEGEIVSDGGIVYDSMPVDSGFGSGTIIDNGTTFEGTPVNSLPVENSPSDASSVISDAGEAIIQAPVDK